jgi:hypothetical protein
MCADQSRWKEDRRRDAVLPEHRKRVDVIVQPAVVEGDDAVTPLGVPPLFAQEREHFMHRQYFEVIAQKRDVAAKGLGRDVHSGLNELGRELGLGHHPVIHENRDLASKLSEESRRAKVELRRAATGKRLHRGYRFEGSHSTSLSPCQ